MVYVTGGLAIARIFNQVNANSATTDKTGWTLGGGFEGALTQRWTWKTEYLYANFGNTPTGCLPLCSPDIVSLPTHVHIVRVGVNYHF